MTSCRECNSQAVIAVAEPLCREHFIASFEQRVRATIDRFTLFSKKDRIAVACSGGKDSTVLLFLLQKFGYDVTALAIDEGIAGYRDATLEDLKRFCVQQNIRFSIHSYHDAFGTALDAALPRLPGVPPCRVCGVWRRYLLNRHAEGFDKLATGHNLDDEAQSILMNLVRGNSSLTARLGPVTGIAADRRFTPRVKPLFLCAEKEVAAYAFLHGFAISFTECPNAEQSFRASIRDLLNSFEQQHVGSKRRLVERFLAALPALKQHAPPTFISACTRCGAPAAGGLCHACLYERQMMPAAGRPTSP